MPAEPLILAIDNGTQSVRALLFDKYGNLISKGKQDLDPYFSEQPGWAEQHPEYFWENLGNACRLLWGNTDAQPSQVVGITVTTQRGTVINLDKHGKPLRPAIIWLDQRHARVDGPVKGPWGWLFKLARLEDTINRFREKNQANWIAQNQPEIWQQTRHFLLLSGYLNYRLTGQFRDSTGSQVGYLPFDYRKHRWAGRRDFKWQTMPVTRAMLPELVEPGGSLGALTPEAAAHLGLPEGLPVMAAASDKACEILGSGGLTPDIGCMSYGTTATINTTSERYVEAIKLMPPYPSALPGRYSTEVMIYRGFWMVSWFKREFGLRERKLAEQRGIEPEVLFDELVRAVPAGSMGLMLQPYWSPGVRQPGPEAKGSIIGFGDVHTRAHIYRAILEGLAYALREGKEKIEKRTGTPIRSLRVAGGGSQSDAAMQLTADVFGLPAERPHTYETSGLGAAIDAAVGLRLHPDFQTAVAAMTRVGDVFLPQPETHALYDRLYSEVYLKMYPQLQPLYRRIREITGYPK
ncbi:FGGY-family carbohydrate kinase [Marinobacter sp. M216]|uniref:FGGY-family carbohydrate kinase n=1 Tax=Marinobacter albus TaxID=3030833 RepID=A0ABT7HC68_9GAMM|nr:MULTISPECIES: FGGY-family carbohydrate kinase [unclassified Marinobacter]MBW7469758.1 FGGY-family carbohydrate kinase [Marinobacter sp. F4218]MDK9557983.1 FGGY-family carbohydrate kinase [Marinobacter sp. M216]